MTITAGDVAKLREMTGAGMMDAKKALTETNGNMEAALEWLRKSGALKMAKKADRATAEGRVHTYTHSNGKVAVMVEIMCETDFVARNEDFKSLAKDIAMHITASNPKYLKPEEVSQEIVDKEKEIWTEQLKSEGKPENIMSKIMEGKEKKFREEISLLTQPFVKNPDQTIGALVTDNIGKIGENIQVGRFCRFEL